MAIIENRAKTTEHSISRVINTKHYKLWLLSVIASLFAVLLLTPAHLPEELALEINGHIVKHVHLPVKRFTGYLHNLHMRLMRTTDLIHDNLQLRLTLSKLHDIE